MERSIIPQRISFRDGLASRPILEKLATEVLGAKHILKDAGLSVLQLSDGTVLELHGTKSFQPDQTLGNANIIVSFRVEDIECAVQYLVEHGALLKDEIVRACPTYAYCYLQLSDNLTIGLYQEDNSI